MAAVTVRPLRPATSAERKGLVEQALILARGICACDSETFEVSPDAVTILLDERAQLAHTLLLVLEKGLEAERRVADLATRLAMQPFPEELRDWSTQRESLLAEIKRLQARILELEATLDPISARRSRR